MDLLFGLPDVFILIGVLIVVIGFAFRVDTLFIVVLAAYVTTLVAKIPFTEFLAQLGSNFVNQRLMTVFILSLPVIGLLERNGLREVSADLISKIKGASSAIILSVYLVIRSIAGALGLRLGGHVQFIRPLVYPMAIAAEEKNGEVSEQQEDNIKGLAAAVENFGNFFAQNVFLAAGGVLLITGTLDSLGYPVEAANIAATSIIMMIVMLVVCVPYIFIVSKKGKGGSK